MEQEIIEYLRQWFTYDGKQEVYISNKKHLGVGTGDDANLYIWLDSSGTHIWWKENRGFERTIFDGIGITYLEELKAIFNLLGLYNYRIFKDEL